VGDEDVADDLMQPHFLLREQLPDFNLGIGRLVFPAKDCVARTFADAL
jgi:hypothetical protein